MSANLQSPRIRLLRFILQNAAGHGRKRGSTIYFTWANHPGLPHGIEPGNALTGACLTEIAAVVTRRLAA